VDALGEGDEREDGLLIGAEDIEVADTGGAACMVGAIGGGSADTAEAPLEFMIIATTAISKIRPMPRITTRRSQ
jgi:hypothetical protein